MPTASDSATRNTGGDILGPGATLTSGAAPTPEAGPLPCRAVSGLASPRRGLGPLLSAGTSGAAPLIPRSRRSAARVLMDEGWSHSKRGLGGGDKLAPMNVTASKPEMRLTTLLAPDQRSDAYGAVVMLLEMPTRAVFGQEVQLYYAPALGGATHRSLLKQTIIAHNIEGSSRKLGR